jgi:hypothetical protein
MAEVTTFQTVKSLVPHSECRVPADISYDMDVASGDASNGDTIVVFEAPADGKIVDAALATDGTLGASCTVRLRTNDGTTQTNLTAATSAGGASAVRMTGFPVNVSGGDKIELLVGGANIGASAKISVHTMFVRD